MGELAYRTLRENVLTEIREKIFNRELAPGTRIVEKKLSDEFGISRGPIREALRQLEQEGLVEYTRNSGCSVKEITIADVYEIYTLRSHCEMLAVKLCGGTFSETEFAEMEQVLEDMKALQDTDIAGLVACDHKLHRIIVRKSNLPRLIKAWDEMYYGNNIAVINSGSYKNSLSKRQYTIHRSLADICHTGDVDAICRAIYGHYMAPVKEVMREEGLPVDDYCFFYGI